MTEIQKKLEFACDQFPLLDAKWNMHKATEEDLIGHEVVAIRSGFGCGAGGGTHMIVQKVEGGFITLVRDGGQRSMAEFETKHNSFIFKEDWDKLR